MFRFGLTKFAKFPSVQRRNLINSFLYRNFYFQEEKHGAGDPHIVAKRVIKTVGVRLKEIDPHRWDGVPITYETTWVQQDKNSFGANLRTCVLIHDALEKEFNIDIDDKRILLPDIRSAVELIMQYHTAV